MVTISCFSYKGGAGRTTLAMNVVPFLVRELGADEDHPLIIADMDVDSCGITFFLNLEGWLNEDHNADNYTVQGMFGSNGTVPSDKYAESVKEHALFSHLAKVGEFFGYQKGTVLCVPAKPGGNLGINNNYDGKPDQIDKFVRECDEMDCAGILFDSAVGDQLTARWSNQFSSKIICCMRPTEQFREGTKRFFEKFDKELGNQKTIVVVPNVVPTDPLTITDKDGTYAYPGYAKKKIKEAFATNISDGFNNYDMTMVSEDFFGVPKIDRFMWHEGVLFTILPKDLNDNERQALKCYEKIAKLLCK